MLDLDLRYDHAMWDHYSYADLNRVETAVQELQELLGLCGYTVSTPCKTDWTRDSPPSQGEIDRIKDNIQALQAAYCYLPDWRRIVAGNRIDYSQVNTWEWDLHLLNITIDAMQSIIPRSAQPLMHCGGYVWYVKTD